MFMNTNMEEDIINRLDRLEAVVGEMAIILNTHIAYTNASSDTMQEILEVIATEIKNLKS